MTKREINELAEWTANSIQGAVSEGGRFLDDAGKDIVREYVESSLIKWKRGEEITLENLTLLLQEIFKRRHNETKTEEEVFNAMLILGSKFPSFVADNRLEREKEAEQIAATLPAVKV